MHRPSIQAPAAELLVVLVTAPDAEVGARLAEGAVRARLAACANLIPGLRSFYVWDGEVQDDSEVQLLFKTTRDRVDALREHILAAHPYDVPEFVVLATDKGSSNAYARFVVSETRPSR